MNLHIYIEDSLGEKLTTYAKKCNRKRNSIIRQAIKDWIERHTEKKWPDSVLKFKGIPTFPNIKSLRNNISTPKNNLF